MGNASAVDLIAIEHALASNDCPVLPAPLQQLSKKIATDLGFGPFIAVLILDWAIDVSSIKSPSASCNSR